MKLYILRHGDAGSPGDPVYTNDDDRPLSPKGIERTEDLARALRRLGVKFDVIFSSPLVRARETAEIVERGLRLKDRTTLTDELAPTGDVARLVLQVNSLQPTPEVVLLVGHEPYLGNLISRLCTREADLTLTLKKGGLARMEVETLRAGHCAHLEWLLAPGALEGKRKK